MKKKVRLWICSFSLTLLLLSTGTLGQESGPYLSLEISKTQVPLEFGQRVVDAEAEFLIDLDPLVVAGDPEVLSLDLYGDTRMVVRRVRSRYYEEWMSWTGTLYFPELLGVDSPAGMVMFTYHGNHISGVIHVEATRRTFRSSVTRRECIV